MQLFCARRHRIAAHVFVVSYMLPFRSQNVEFLGEWWEGLSDLNISWPHVTPCIIRISYVVELNMNNKKALKSDYRNNDAAYTTVSMIILTAL